jgi:hypothetical protein
MGQGLSQQPCPCLPPWPTVDGSWHVGALQCPSPPMQLSVAWFALRGMSSRHNHMAGLLHRPLPPPLSCPTPLGCCHALQDVWVLCLARQLVIAGLVAGVHPWEACQRNHRSMGAPLAPNHPQVGPCCCGGSCRQQQQQQQQR